MRANVAETSKEAFYSIKNEGRELNQKESITAFLEENPYPFTRREIAEKLGFELGATAGRVNALVAEKQLLACGTTKCPVTGRRVGLVRTPMGAM